MNRAKIKILLFLYNSCLFLAIVAYLVFLLITFKFQRFFQSIKKNLIIYKKDIMKIYINNNFNIWIHAASVGESLLIFQIIKELLVKYSNYTFIVTSCTKSSRDLWIKEFGDQITHYYLPWDLSFLAKGFIKCISPKLAIFVEADFWPNYLFALKDKQIPVLLLNGRMSNKSFVKWQKVRGLISELLNVFSAITVDSIKSYEHIKYFIGPQKIKYLGNLKYSLKNKKLYNNSELDYIKLPLKNRIIILALSTHYPEEDMFKEIYLEFKKIIPNLFTIIIPRHVNRSKNIFTSLKKAGLNVKLFSNYDNIARETDILLVDVFGKTSLFFEFSKIVYIGKSMFKNAQGGHNLLEPMRSGVPVIFGPYMNNFLEIYEEAIKENAAIQANNPEELKKVLLSLLKDTNKLRLMSENAKNLANRDYKTKENSIQLIESFLHI